MAWHSKKLSPKTQILYQSAVNRLLTAAPPLLNTVMTMIRAGAKVHTANDIQAFMANQGHYMHPRQVNQAINGLQRGMCPNQYRISRVNRWYDVPFNQEPAPFVHGELTQISANHPIIAPSLQPSLNIL